LVEANDLEALMKTCGFRWLVICVLIVCASSAVQSHQVEPKSERKTESNTEKSKPGSAPPAEIERSSKPAEAPERTDQVSPAASKVQIPRWLQRVKAWTEAPAYALAFLFFLYKLYIGQFTTNLSLKISCKRANSNDPGKDQLAVVVTVKKGENGLIKPLVANVRVLELGSKTPHDGSLDLKRVGYRRSGVFKIKIDAIDWNVAKKHWPLLNFPPGDESQFACYFEVSSAEICQIDVVLMGKRSFKFKTSQWRASDISLPSDKHNQPAKVA
jgi:hypothetical protein